MPNLILEPSLFQINQQNVDWSFLKIDSSYSTVYRLLIHNLRNERIIKRDIFGKYINSPRPTSYMVKFDPSLRYYNTPITLSDIVSDFTLRESLSLYVAKFFDSLYQSFTDEDHAYSSTPFYQAFGGVRRSMQHIHDPKALFLNYFRLVKIAVPNTIHQLLEAPCSRAIPFFSFVKTQFHLNADFLPIIWYLYVELDTIAGYPKTSERKEGDDPIQWLSVDVNDQHNPQWWSLFITKVLTEAAIQPKEPLLSFSDFLHRRWLWVTDGACPDSKLKLDDVRIKSKFGAAVSLSDTELFNAVLHSIAPNSTNLSIFIKPDERGFKKRLIANMDLGSYLIAAYVKYLIEYLCGPVPKWMTATTDSESDMNAISQIRIGNVNIPLDESQFDHHLSHNAWLGFIDSLKHLYPHNYGLNLFEQLFHNTLYLTENGKYPWYKGMPSGLALTAIGNTLFNFVKQMFIVSPLHWALGDDALLVNNTYTLDQISEYYNTYGSEVNPLKNWTSQKYSEYLHFLYNDYGRVGYPARMYGSLCFALKFTDSTPIQRINELSLLWKDFYDRAALLLDEQYISADLSRSVSRTWKGFSTTIARRWLHIPKALGGFGLLPYHFEEFKIENKAYRISHYSGNLIELPEVKVPVKTDFRICRLRKFAWTSYRLGRPRLIPAITTIKQWEDRLNMREDYKQEDLQVIPLPEIPFVSTTRVSAFASRYRFNIFPNKLGNRASYIARLISASFGLATLILSWMRDHNVMVYV